MLPATNHDRATAPLTRDPFAELERVARDMLSWTSDWRLPGLDGFHTVLGDLEETDDAFVVDVDLPGVTKRDVDVQIEGRRLTITAERKERERTGILRRRTRTVGTYRHEVLLPAEVDEESVEATLADGVLTVRLPKTATTKRRRIEVR